MSRTRALQMILCKKSYNLFNKNELCNTRKNHWQKLTHWPSSLILPFIVGLLLYPLLAISPQDGEGAALVSHALGRALMNPLGHPFQMGLQKLFIQLPFAEPAKRIALLSLVSHLLTLFVLLEILRLLAVGFLSRFFAVLSFGFFPSVWVLAVQPSVYPLTLFFVAVIIYLFVFFYMETRTGGGQVFSIKH